MTALLIAIGAAIGAPLRYLADRFVQSRHDSVFPWGTFMVNVAGSGLLGLIVGATSNEHVLAAGALGFCGALTTYSTFSYETVRLIGARARMLALANVTASLVGGLGAALVGLAVGGAIFG
jgi:fluoride exporter